MQSVGVLFSQTMVVDSGLSFARPSLGTCTESGRAHQLDLKGGGHGRLGGLVFVFVFFCSVDCNLGWV